MKLKQISKSAMVLALSASFLIPHAPKVAFAQQAPGGPIDLFPIDDEEEDDTGLTPPPGPFIPGTNGGGNGGAPGGIGGRPGVGGNNGGNNNGGKPQQRPGKVTMFPAKVPEDYSCAIFDNGNNTTIYKAIDSLSNSIKNIPKEPCTGKGIEGEALQNNALKIQTSINSLKKLAESQDPSSIKPNQISQPVTEAILALSEIGKILDNNEFLNSECGKHTLSGGQFLIQLNEVINGLAPLALQAAATSPAALPYVIGGSVASSAISTIAKLHDQNSLDMSVDEHRKALLQNTCQYMKIAAKEDLLKKALDGQAEVIKNKLALKKKFYFEKYDKLKNLSATFTSRDQVNEIIQALENQVQADQSELNSQNSQINSTDNDDDMVCIVSNNMLKSASDSDLFPGTILQNLEKVINMDSNERSEAENMKAFTTSKFKAFKESAKKSTKVCAANARLWLKSLQSAINITTESIRQIKSDINKKLFSEKNYGRLLSLYNRAQTIQKFENAIEELTNSNSIDLSELSQRMDRLKAGLFGFRDLSKWKTIWKFMKPPVLSWIEHTFEQHKLAVNRFSAELRGIREQSHNMTLAAKYGLLATSELKNQGRKEVKFLANLNLSLFPSGSDRNKEVCKSIKAAKEDWNASNYHLEAVELFCNMINPVLDKSVDQRIIKACKSTLNEIKAGLHSGGLVKDAALIKQRQKELNCETLANLK